MSRKWLEREGRDWTKRGIITNDQYERILELYPEQKRATGLVPILGSILIGLGILSFVAANWQDIPQLVRLILIIAVMTGFYTAGWLVRTRDHEKLSAALISLGLITFGAGIVLVSQMFHLVAYDITSFIVWGIVGLLLTYLIKSRYLFLIGLLIFTWAQWYNATQFYTFSYVAYAISVIGFGYYWWRHKNAFLGWCLASSFILQSLMAVVAFDWPFTWFFVPVWLLYAIIDGVKERRAVYSLQAVPLIAAFTFNMYLVLFWQRYKATAFHEDVAAQPIYYCIILAVLLGVSLLGKTRNNRLSSGADWVLAIPFFYLTHGTDLLYLLTLFAFSLYLLWRGYAEEWRLKINLGTLLFLCSTMAAYGKLAWDFMDKSVFFIVGGLLLLVLSWFLNRRKKQFLVEIEEDNRHDDK